MRRWTCALGAAVLAFAAQVALAAPESCGVCHGEQRTEFESSVHRLAEVGCVTCHGGDGAALAKDAAHSAAKGYRGPVARRDVAEACGNCHADIARMRPFGLRTDALAAYRISHHGKAMLEQGRTDAATCSDCHGVHGVRRVADEASPAHRTNVPATCGRCHGDAQMMERHGIRTHAVEDFAKSVHGTLLARGERGVPTCADCHDAHAATPPGATEVADVCGSCHQETRDRFRESPHATAFRGGSMHQCITCHGNHAVGRPDHGLFDAVVDGGAESERVGTRCLSCHDADNDDDRGTRTAKSFGNSLRDAESALESAFARVEALGSQGFRVDDEHEALTRAQRELRAALPLTHTADVARVDGALRHVRSLVAVALAGCDGKIVKARDRRIFGSGAGVVLLVASAFLMLRGRRVRGHRAGDATVAAPAPPDAGEVSR